MTGRERCDRLKKIRKGLADRIGVDLHQTVCTYEGECRGTCPKCKQEEDILNAALIRKGTAIAGATVVATSLAACTPATIGSGISQLLGGDDTVDVGGGPELSGVAQPYPDEKGTGGDDIVELSGEVAEPSPDDDECDTDGCDDDCKGTDDCDGNCDDDSDCKDKGDEPVDVDQIELSGDVAYIDEDE